MYIKRTILKHLSHQVDTQARVQRLWCLRSLSSLLAFYCLTYVMQCCKTLSLNERRPPSLQACAAAKIPVSSGMLLSLVVLLLLQGMFKLSDDSDDLINFSRRFYVIKRADKNADG